MSHPYKPISRYPSAHRDITINVGAATTWRDIYNFLGYAAPHVPLVASIDFVSVFHLPDLRKNITLRLTFQAMDRTLTSDEIADTVETIWKSLETIGAVRPGEP